MNNMNYINKTNLLKIYLYIRSLVYNFINIMTNNFFSFREILIVNGNNKKDITTKFSCYIFFSNIIKFLGILNIKCNYKPKLKYELIQIKKIYNNEKFKLKLSNERTNIIYLNEYINKNIKKIYEQFTPIIIDYYIYKKDDEKNKLDIQKLIKSYNDTYKLFDHNLKNIFIINKIKYEDYDKLYYNIFDNIKGPISKRIDITNVLKIHINDIYKINNNDS